MKSGMVSPKAKLCIIQNMVFVNKIDKSVIYKLLQAFIENGEQ